MISFLRYVCCLKTNILLVSYNTIQYLFCQDYQVGEIEFERREILVLKQMLYFVYSKSGVSNMWRHGGIT